MRIIASHFAIFHKFQTEWEATVITDHNLPFFIFFSDITPEWEATVVGNHSLPGGYGRPPPISCRPTTNQMLGFRIFQKVMICS